MSNQYPSGYPAVPVSTGLMNSPHSYSGSPGPISSVLNSGMPPMPAGISQGLGPSLGPGMNSGMNQGMVPGMNAGLPTAMPQAMASGGGGNLPSGMGMGGLPPGMHGSMQPVMSAGMPPGLQTGMSSGIPSVLSSALGGNIPTPITSRMSPVIGPSMQQHSMQGPMVPNMSGPMVGGMAAGLSSAMTPIPMQYSMGPGANNSVQGPQNIVQAPPPASTPSSVACDSGASTGATAVAPARLATPNTAQENAAAAQSSRDINTASLCRIGQETVQDIVSRTLEIYQTLKPIQPPNGTAAGANAAHDRKSKIQEQLRTIRKLFIGLRLVYEKCNDNSQLQGLEYTHIESLIPLKDEWDGKSEERKNSEAYRGATEEYRELVEAVGSKNKILKDIIDHVRRIIWEINTMLMMRRS